MDVKPTTSGFPSESKEYQEPKNPTTVSSVKETADSTTSATLKPAQITGRIISPTCAPMFLNLFQTSVACCTLFLEYSKAASVSPDELVTSCIDSLYLVISEVKMANAFLASLSTKPIFSRNDDFCSSFMSPITPCNSPNTSTRLLIFPVSSKTLTPDFASLSRTSPRPKTEKAFSIRTAARSADCPFPVI